MPREDEREYQRVYHQQRYALRKSAMHSFLGGKCVECDEAEDLEIHHRDPDEKEFNLTDVYSHPWEKLVEELKKCELRCKKHHRERHSTTHGQMRMYKLGCRCAACVAKMRSDARTYGAAYKNRRKGHDGDGRRLKVSLSTVERIMALRSADMSYASIAKALGVSSSVVHRIVNDASAVAYIKEHARVAQLVEVLP